ncbi:MAG: 2-oxoacid:acceptor oxidoreductase subunit alpha, partial [Thermoplasmata archaeon]
PAQGDVMQSRFGTHGDYESIVYAPNSPQEMLDLTIKAFNTAETLRTPVTVLSDEIVGHLRERVEVPEKVEVVNR